MLITIPFHQLFDCFMNLPCGRHWWRVRHWPGDLPDPCVCGAWFTLRGRWSTLVTTLTAGRRVQILSSKARWTSTRAAGPAPNATCTVQPKQKRSTLLYYIGAPCGPNGTGRFGGNSDRFAGARAGAPAPGRNCHCTSHAQLQMDLGDTERCPGHLSGMHEASSHNAKVLRQLSNACIQQSGDWSSVIRCCLSCAKGQSLACQ